MYLTGSTVTVSGASFTSCTASVRRTHNSRRHSHTAIAVRQPAPTYHTTPHSTTRRHTSHPPPSPLNTPLSPLRAKGRLLLPSVSCPTLAPVRSLILTLSRPSLHHHQHYHTITNPALPPLHPHSSLFFLPPPILPVHARIDSDRWRRHIALCPIRSRTRCWVGRCTARCCRGVSVFRASSRSPSPCDP